uniref:Uncharacterized protein n=1 Tax=Anguilla anguilla TaxID=7936 RepID=A0A0E9QHQ9_ANGAN
MKNVKKTKSKNRQRQLKS